MHPTCPRIALTYSYDGGGNLSSVASSNADGVSVAYGYDVLSRLQTVTDNRQGGAVTSYGFDDVGNLSSVLLPNGVRTVYGYDTLNRLTDVTAGLGATQIAGYHYTLGAAGNRTSVSELGGRTAVYTYDDLYRLTREEVAGDPNGINGRVDYTLDDVGNRTSRTSTLAGVASSTDSYDANDRLDRDVYDANGNTVGSNGNGYGYDFENRLVVANEGTPLEVRYVYDGDGNRVAKTAGGVTTRYLVDSNNLTGYAQVVEELVSGAVTRQYTYGLDLISERQFFDNEWQTGFYGCDGHGSVRYLTDGSGVVTDRYDYDAFGVLIHQTGTTPNEYLYSGEQFDGGLGFYYLRARYLDQDSGRFLRFDDFEGLSAVPGTLHKYAYVLDNPTGLVDPSGKCGCTVAELNETLELYTEIRAQSALNAVVAGDSALATLDAAVPEVIAFESVGAVVTPFATVAGSTAAFLGAFFLGVALSSLGADNSDEPYSRVYHYTNKRGFNGINSQANLLFKASSPPSLDKSFGVYFTNLPPDTPQLARRLRISREKVTYYFYVEIPTRQLHRISGGRGDYTLYSSTDVIVPKNRVIARGPNPFVQ